MNWITDQLATASFYEINTATLSPDVTLIDTREIIDEEGNIDTIISKKVSAVLDALGKGQKVLVCCDKGISRSNSIALGALLATGMPYDKALDLFYLQGLMDMNLSLLHQVRRIFSPVNYEQAVPDGVLITGASGFIGRHLTAKLTGTTRLFCPDRNELDISSELLKLDTYVHKNRIKTIIHLAHPRDRSSISALGTGIKMTKNILEVCRVNGCNLLFISSLGVFSGNISDEPLLSSTINPLPRGTYGETKYLCEELIKCYRATFGVKANILRPAVIYGPGQDSATFIEKYFVAAIANTTIITHEYQNGRPIFDFLYIDDFIEAISISLRQPHESDLALGTGKAYTTLEVANIIRKICNSRSQIETLVLAGKTYKIIFDPSDAKIKIGWEPKFTLEQGLKEIWARNIKKR